MMKRFLVIALTLLAVFTAKAQTDSLSYDAQVDSLYSIFNNDGDYNKVVEQGEKLAATLNTIGTPTTDSLYVYLQGLLGKCYFRINKPELAGQVVDKGIERMKKLGIDNSVNYSILLDNAALYYLSADKYDIGLQHALEALNVMNNYPDKAVSADMMIILLHVAEGSFYNNKFQDAIVYEIRGLGTAEKLYGKHSEEYINELPYLSKYYKAVGDEKRAEETDEETDQLQKEYDNGERDIPDPDERDLSSADECHKYNYEALRCANYYLEHKLAADHMNRCVQYLTRWSIASPDVTINLDNNFSKLLSNEKSLPYFVAYLAASTKYFLENNDTTFDIYAYRNIMIDVLNFYIANSDYTGKVKFLQQLVDVYNNKGVDALREALDKNYAKEYGKK